VGLDGSGEHGGGAPVGIETAVWRALAVFRALGLLYAAVVYLRRYDEYAHPAAGWLVLGLMAVWTVVVGALYARPAGRRWPVLALDLAIAAATVLGSRWLDDPDRIAAGAQTLPVVWAASPVLAFALRGGWPAGVGAALVVGGADVAQRGAVTVNTANNIVLLLLAGAVVGWTVQLARRGEQALAEAQAVEAATRERARLARDIHDGVLQVLALVGRRGQQAGGEAAEIGRLAAEQEQALRALVADGPAADDATGEVDLRGLLSAYSSSSVHVATPASPVLLAAGRARDLAAAVGAALANVEAHAGPTAQAWVLLEDEGDEVVVSVRDDGAGFDPARLGEARAEGRLGVASSIAGRVRDLGGTMAVESAPGAGTEVELRVPAEGAT
jgi:signal transduction histidine kinase